MFNGINVVSISVSDLEKLRRFYGETLGLGQPGARRSANGNRLQMCSPAPE